MDTTRIDPTQAAPDPTMARWFVGDVRFQPLVRGRDVELLTVFFPAGARTLPHIHQDDQVLSFVEGRGIVATETETTHTTAGDFVSIPAGTWHWHGAAKDAATVHISIKRPGPTNWEVEEKNWGEGYT